MAGVRYNPPPTKPRCPVILRTKKPVALPPAGTAFKTLGPGKHVFTVELIDPTQNYVNTVHGCVPVVSLRDHHFLARDERGRLHPMRNDIIPGWTPTAGERFSITAVCEPES